MPVQQLEQVLNEIQQTLNKIPHQNICQDLPPNNTHYTHYQYLDGRIGKMIVKPTGQKLFVPIRIYQKIMSTVQLIRDNEKIYAHTQKGLDRLHPEEVLAIGTISHFLDL